MLDKPALIARLLVQQGSRGLISRTLFPSIEKGTALQSRQVSSLHDEEDETNSPSSQSVDKEMNMVTRLSRHTPPERGVRELMHQQWKSRKEQERMQAPEEASSALGNDTAGPQSDTREETGATDM